MMVSMVDDDSGTPDALRCLFRGCPARADQSTLRPVNVGFEAWSSVKTEFGWRDKRIDDPPVAMPLCREHNKLLLAIANNKALPAARRDPALSRIDVKYRWDWERRRMAEVWVVTIQSE